MTPSSNPFSTPLVVTLLLAVLATVTPAAAVPVDPDAPYTSSLEIEALPDQGFLAVWSRDTYIDNGPGPDQCVPFQPTGAFLSAAGTTIGEPAELALPIEPASSNQAVGVFDVAVLESDVTQADGFDALFAWNSTDGLHAGRLTSGLTVPSSEEVGECAGPSEVKRLDVVASGNGFWLFWVGDCEGFQLHARRFDTEGEPQGDTIFLGDVANGALDVAGVAAPGGGAHVVWTREAADSSRQLVARLVESSDSFGEVVPITDVTNQLGRVDFDVAQRVGGGLQVSWTQDDTLWLRHFAAGLEPVGEATAVPSASANLLSSPVLASNGANTALSHLVVSAGAATFSCPVDLFTGGSPVPVAGGLLPADCIRPDSAAFARSGDLLFGYRLDAMTPLISDCTQVAVAPVAGETPPPVEGFMDPAFPDFQFHVRIGGDEPNPRIGMVEPLCLPETVCVSGALEGRSEVLLRVVGPKPNNRLWPTIVRFTTSQVEVWIEQLSTGQTEYYLLEGSSPGSEELDGLFDREGFPPS